MKNVYLGFNPSEFELVRDAPSNPDAAGKCLAAYAARIRLSLAPGDFLGKHIVEALEKAAATPASRRALALTHALCLTTGRQRPKANAVLVGMDVEYEIRDGKSATAAIQATAERFDMSVRQVRRHFEMVKQAREDADNF